jgi:two-component system, cell cycle response regulator DivK
MSSSPFLRLAQEVSSGRSVEPPPSRKRILIVEDNELNLKLLHDVLEAHGYTVFVSREGSAVLRMAREQHPHLILMDLMLPDISGLEVTRQIKSAAETRGIPVVAVTAFAMVGDERKALAAGCDAYIAKPIVLREFIGMVERMIGTATRLG